MKIAERDTMINELYTAGIVAADNYADPRFIRIRWTKKHGAKLVAVIGEDGEPTECTGSSDLVQRHLDALTDPKFAASAYARMTEVAGYTYDYEITDESFVEEPNDDAFHHGLVKPIRDASGGEAEAYRTNFEIDGVDDFWVLHRDGKDDEGLIFGHFALNNIGQNNPFLFRQTGPLTAVDGFEHELDSFATRLELNYTEIVNALVDIGGYGDANEVAEEAWEYFRDRYDLDDDTEYVSVARTLLEGHVFKSQNGEYDFVACWSIMIIDAGEAHVPRFRVNPAGRAIGDPFEFLVITEPIAEEFTIGRTILPQGENRDEAMDWLESAPNSARELFQTAETISLYGTLRDSPIEKPILVVDGGAEALRR